MRKLFQALITAAIFVALILIFARNLDQLSGYEFTINWIYVVVSMLFLCAFYVFYSYGWGLIAEKLGHKLGFRKALHIKMVSDISRYLPGKVWCFIVRAQKAKKEGMPYRTTMGSMALEFVINIAGASTVFLIALFYIADALPGTIIFFAVAVIMLYIVFNPKVFAKAINFCLKKLKKKPIKVDIGMKDLLKLTLLYVMLWFVMGAGFFFLVKSIYSVNYSLLPLMAALFAGSWVAGYASFISPAGLGVREGALAFLLSLVMPTPMAIVLSIVSRLWMIVGEVIVVAFVYKDK